MGILLFWLKRINQWGLCEIAIQSLSRLRYVVCGVKLLVVLYTGWCSHSPQSSSAPRSSRPVRRRYVHFANTNSARRAPARGRDNHGRKPRLCITVCGSSRRVPLLALRAAAITRLYASYLLTHMPLIQVSCHHDEVSVRERALQFERSKVIFFSFRRACTKLRSNSPPFLPPLGHPPCMHCI